MDFNVWGSRTTRQSLKREKRGLDQLFFQPKTSLAACRPHYRLVGELLLSSWRWNFLRPNESMQEHRHSSARASMITVVEFHILIRNQCIFTLHHINSKDFFDKSGQKFGSLGFQSQFWRAKINLVVLKMIFVIGYQTKRTTEKKMISLFIFVLLKKNWTNKIVSN